ncbi:MAG: hypothetical protein BAJALOKI1v1_490002 [Promethearchaeota archaeon]|nr:MAG: hypothetical protein BAJALOKI1v1_490002 [Candidatus Lokiarchaeota archaeon]
MTKKFSFKNIKKLLKANSLANKIKHHYQNFPKTPDKFPEWVTKAEKLWNQKQPAIKKLSTGEIIYK